MQIAKNELHADLTDEAPVLDPPPGTVEMFRAILASNIDLHLLTYLLTYLLTLTHQIRIYGCFAKTF